MKIALLLTMAATEDLHIAKLGKDGLTDELSVIIICSFVAGVVDPMYMM